MKGCLFLPLACILILASCASTKQAENSTVSPVYITNTKKFYLLSPAYIQGRVDAQQLLTGKFGENEFSMLSYLQMDEKGIYLSLFNDFGVGMGNLTYDGISADFDSPVFPKNLKAEYIVADLQFAYYSVDAINETLETIGMYIDVIKTQKGEIRTIYSNSILPMMTSQTIEVIVKNGSEINIENILRGYEYNLKEAE